MEDKDKKTLAAELTQCIIEELKADIKAGKITDPRLILHFGEDNDTKN